MPVTLDEMVIKRVALRVEEFGERPGQVARRLGVTARQWQAWWSAGCDHEDAEGDALTEHQALCVALVEAVRRAESVCERNWLALWQEKAREPKPGLWQPWATLLERRFPDGWRKREMAQTQAPGEVSIEDEFRKMSAAEARKALGG